MTGFCSSSHLKNSAINIRSSVLHQELVASVPCSTLFHIWPIYLSLYSFPLCLTCLDFDLFSTALPDCSMWTQLCPTFHYFNVDKLLIALIYCSMLTFFPLFSCWPNFDLFSFVLILTYFPLFPFWPNFGLLSIVLMLTKFWLTYFVLILTYFIMCESFSLLENIGCPKWITYVKYI